MKLFKFVLIATAIGVASPAHAQIPSFAAECPQQHYINADRAGTVRVNGVEARVRKFNEQYYEARVGGNTYTISLSPNRNRLQVGYNPPGRAGGNCKILVYTPAPSGNSSASAQPAAGEFARVKGVASNDVLNVRSGPGTNYRVVGALANGDRVRRLRCQTQGSSRWCEIEMQTDMRERGWVNARFLALNAGSGMNGDLRGTPAQFDRMVRPCVAQASRLTGAPSSSIRVLDRIRTGGGPILTLRANGAKYTCRLEANGRVTVFSEYAN